jgi:hypothetical protein
VFGQQDTGQIVASAIIFLVIVAVIGLLLLAGALRLVGLPMLLSFGIAVLVAGVVALGFSFSVGRADHLAVEHRVFVDESGVERTEYVVPRPEDAVVTNCQWGEWSDHGHRCNQAIIDYLALGLLATGGVLIAAHVAHARHPERHHQPPRAHREPVSAGSNDPRDDWWDAPW